MYAHSICHQSMNSSGGFCAGSRIVVDHQHINSTSFVFSITVPTLLSVSTSLGINILQYMPPILNTYRRTCTRFARCSTISARSRSPRTQPRRSSTSTYVPRRCCLLRLRRPRTPLPRLHAIHRSLTLWARSTSCRTSCTMCSRRRVDHADSAAAWAGARWIAEEHLPRRDDGAVA